MRAGRGAAPAWFRTLAAAGVLAAGGMLTACGGDEGGPPTANYVVSGVVTEVLSGRAVSGVTVTFTSDTLYTDSTKTDEDGKYTLRVESDTPFGQVRAEKAGYTPAEATVYFDSSPRRLDLRIREALPDGG